MNALKQVPTVICSLFFNGAFLKIHFQKAKQLGRTSISPKNRDLFLHQSIMTIQNKVSIFQQKVSSNNHNPNTAADHLR